MFIGWIILNIILFLLDEQNLQLFLLYRILDPFERNHIGFGCNTGIMTEFEYSLDQGCPSVWNRHIERSNRSPLCGNFDNQKWCKITETSRYCKLHREIQSPSLICYVCGERKLDHWFFIMETYNKRSD